MYHVWQESKNGASLMRKARLPIRQNPNDKPILAPAAFNSRAAARPYVKRLEAQDPGRRVMTIECWQEGCTVCAAAREWEADRVGAKAGRRPGQAAMDMTEE